MAFDEVRRRDWLQAILFASELKEDAQFYRLTTDWAEAALEPWFDEDPQEELDEYLQRVSRAHARALLSKVMACSRPDLDTRLVGRVLRAALDAATTFVAEEVDTLYETACEMWLRIAQEHGVYDEVQRQIKSGRYGVASQTVANIVSKRQAEGALKSLRERARATALDMSPQIERMLEGLANQIVAEDWKAFWEALASAEVIVAGASPGANEQHS